MPPSRYKLNRDGHFVASPTGQWVRAEDVDFLLARLESLEGFLTMLTSPEDPPVGLSGNPLFDQATMLGSIMAKLGHYHGRN